MRRKFVAVLLSVTLAAGLTPCLAWAEGPITAARADISVQAPADAEAARQAVADAQAAVAEAQAAVADAQAVVNKGSLGFFQSVGATSAVDALTKATYKEYTQVGSQTDATSLGNMMASIEIVERCNEIRKENGLGALSITDYLMATSQSDANYSDTNIAHAQQFSVAENLAWNWQSDDLSSGVKTAFRQWYDDEKAIWDSAKATGKYTSKYGGTHEIPASAFDLNAYELSQQYNDFYLNVGHYLNVIGPDYTVSGGAINTNGTNYGVTYAQNFSWSAPAGEQAYSVAEYRERFVKYCNEAYGNYNEATENLEGAKAKLADAQSDLADAQSDLAGFQKITDSDVSLATATFTYDGQPKRPAVTVTVGGVKLSEGTDYTVTYANNVNAGTASMRVEGTGSYSGNGEATFKIARAANPAKVTAKQKTVKHSKLKKKARGVYPISVSGAKGAVSYAKVSKGSSPKLSVDKSTGKITVKAKSKKNTYKVRVVVSIAGDSNYEPLVKTVVAKVKVR